MTDREEREQVLGKLTNMRDWMEAIQQINSSYSTPQRINALNYAISSIKTDLKYDLLYEDNQIADADKMIAEDNSCEPNKSEIPTGSTTKNDLVTIHIEGLDEEIRCVMCSNRMKSDRGCDGSCVVDNAMYKKVMDVIERRIQPTTRNDCAEQNGCITCSLDDGDDCCRKLYEESMQEPTTKKDLAVDCIDKSTECKHKCIDNDLEVDCVDRREVINRIFYSTDNSGDVVLGSALRERIEKLPSVAPKGETVTEFADRCRECGARYGRLLNQKWIPVSERLPEPNRLVLCYITTGTTETYFLAFWNDTLNAWEEGIGGYRLLENDLGYEVIAWMPLPKEYNAETER